MSLRFKSRLIPKFATHLNFFEYFCWDKRGTHEKQTLELQRCLHKTLLVNLTLLVHYYNITNTCCSYLYCQGLLPTIQIFISCFQMSYYLYKQYNLVNKLYIVYKQSVENTLCTLKMNRHFFRLKHNCSSNSHITSFEVKSFLKVAHKPQSVWKIEIFWSLGNIEIKKLEN